VPSTGTENEPSQQFVTEVEDEDEAVINTIFGDSASSIVTIEEVASAMSTDSVLQSLQPVKLPSGPWRKISLDIAGECVAAPRGHRFMLVVVAEVF
jgi:hypothetical protein